MDREIIRDLIGSPFYLPAPTRNQAPSQYWMPVEERLALVKHLTKLTWEQSKKST